MLEKDLVVGNKYVVPYLYGKGCYLSTFLTKLVKKHESDSMFIFKGVNAVGNEIIIYCTFDNLPKVVEYEEPIVAYINVYPDQWFAHHKTREGADKAASPHRVSCVKITLPIGRFDD